VIGLLCLLNTSHKVSARDCAPAGENCTLPDCLCPDWEPPAGLAVNTVPQIVFLTFDDAITISNYPLYEELIFSRTNPNGAKITSTYFVTHEYNDYSLTHQMWRKGHEIALHSITHKADTSYWATIDEATWIAEVCDQKKQLAHFAKIPPADIKGFRVPFLQLGGDTQFTALHGAECGLTYDCSRPTRIYAGPNPAKLWPYTMDYDVTFQDCQNAPCPTQPHPGFWTVPMVSLFGNNTFPCAMIDTCLPQPTTREETYYMLKTNFDNHYVISGVGNRAPFGVYTHAAWLQGVENEGRKNGYIDFLNYLETRNDVFIVSVEKGLEWMKNPVPMAQIGTFDPWKDTPEPTNQCSFAFPCAFTNDQTPFPGERYMQSCQVCPRNYPWINNYLGTS